MKFFRTPFANLSFVKTKYVNGVMALQAWCNDEGYLEQFSTISVNLNTKPAKGCFWAKSWSENEKIYNYLVDNEFIKPTGKSQRAGYACAFECKTTDKLTPYLEEHLC